jgi:hypothetical protein
MRRMTNSIKRNLIQIQKTKFAKFNLEICVIYQREFFRFLPFFGKTFFNKKHLLTKHFPTKHSLTKNPFLNKKHF